jgi:hypothetical protein
VQGGAEPEDESDDPTEGETFIAAEESEAAEAAGALAATAANLALVDDMLALGPQARPPTGRARSPSGGMDTPSHDLGGAGGTSTA